MGVHRLGPRWWDPANGIRFITPEGHLVRTADGERVAHPRYCEVVVGVPWGDDDSNDD